MFELLKSKHYHVYILEAGRVYKDKKIGRVEVVHAKHNDIISDCSSVGLMFNINNYRLLYTGDTGISEPLVNKYKEIVRKNAGEDIKFILLAHLGGFKHYEKDYDAKSYQNFYKNHLGRLGIAKLVDIVKPMYCLISEFGEEFKGHRIELTETFQKIFDNDGGNTTFLPCDIGLKIIFDGEQLNTFGITKINKSKPIIEEGIFPLEDIAVELFEADYSLHYYDNTTGITSNEVFLSLRDEYREIKNI